MDKIIDKNLLSKFIRLLYIATAIGAFTDIFDTSVVGGGFGQHYNVIEDYNP